MATGPNLCSDNISLGYMIEPIDAPDHVSKIRIVGSVFSGPGKDGDFSWMIDQPEYSNFLFVFNDNEEQFFAFMNRSNESDRSIACSRGGGNAAIRPYQCLPIPRAAGIPTGSCGKGYEILDDRVLSIIDQAINRIRNLVSSNMYVEIVFSQDPNRPTLGTGIFNPCDQVKDYIYSKLMELRSE